MSEGDVLKVTDISDFPSTSVYHTLSASDIQAIKDTGILAKLETSINNSMLQEASN